VKKSLREREDRWGRGREGKAKKEGEIKTIL